ncbi:hypothetical protein P8C59_000958 [Phyllachora maydis]|uniref:Reverse transcriptase Ty1/copia-type domain-containing protein n=1 Tax=Phyllachora maydis TaxID=1825666 RepID=A0AAD9M793_9PEZI|nr:hypothetical protein P8C59_000958 [Phyllachora maydis]
MADQAKGKGIAPKRASNPADPGQSSRPLPPIRTLLEDKEDGEDYSEVIEVLKHVSAIKNISSTLASLTNSSNAMAATIGKTSYSPRFDPFSGTIDLDSPLCPPRKEPYLGLAVNSATSNLDPLIDIGSKEGFKDTISSSIVKELSKKAYTIPDDKNPDISNTYSNSDQAVLLMLLRNSLSSSPRAAILWIHIPSKAFKLLARMLGLIASSLNIEYLMADILEESRNPAIEAYRAAHIANSSNSTPNSNSNPSKKGKNKKKGKKKASYNVKRQNYSARSAEQASFMLGSYNLAIEEEEESDSSSRSSSSSDSNTQLAQLLALKGYKKRKDFKGKGLKTSSNKTKYKDNKPRRRPRDPALYNSQLRPINTGNGPVSPAGIGSITLEVLSRKAPPTYTKLVLDNVLYLPNIDINIVSRVRHYDSGGCLIKETLYGGDRRCIAVLDFKKSGFFLNVKGSSKPILYANFAFPLGLSSYTTKSIEPQRHKIVVEIPSNSIRKEDYRPIIEDAIVSEAIEPNKRYKLRNSPAKGTTLEGAPYQSPCKTREPEPLTGTGDLPYVLREPVIKGNKVVEKAISSPTLKEPNIGQRDYYNLLNLAKLWHVRLGHIGLRLLKKTSSITKGLPNFDKIKEADFHCSSYNRGKAVRRVSKALIPDLPRVLDLIEGDTVKIRPRPYNRNPIVLLLVNRKKRYRAIGAKGEAIIPLEKRSKLLKFTSRTEECKLLAVLGSKTYLVYIPSRTAVLKTSTVKFIEDNTVLSQPTNNTALEGELVDLDLDSEGAVSPDPSNLNTEKPISIEIGPIESTRPTISIRKPELPEAFPQTIEPTFAPKPIEVIAPNQPITNEPLNNSDLISERDKMQLDYYKLLAKTSSYILDERSKWLEAITKEFIQLLELGVFKFLPRSLLPSNCKLITYRNVLKVKKDAKNRPIKYKSRLVARGFIQVEGLDYTITYASTRAFLKSALREEIYIEIPKGLLDLAASNKAIYKLLLKYSYNPSTPNIIKLSKALYNLGVFYNAKTCHFIVTYIDDCLFIGPNIGYITDSKKRLNKLSKSLNRLTKSHLNAAKNLFKYLNSTKDYSICFSYNGNTIADLGPKLGNSSNTTTKLSRDFHSEEWPRPLTTTSTTIVDSRNSKGSSRTSIINSSLVPIGFSDSDFIGDKATSKSTYSYLYKLAGRPISWKTKRATTIALSTLEAETDGLIEAIRGVQWIIGLFSKLHRPIDYPITLYGDN